MRISTSRTEFDEIRTRLIKMSQNLTAKFGTGCNEIEKLFEAVFFETVKQRISYQRVASKSSDGYPPICPDRWVRVDRGVFARRLSLAGVFVAGRR